MTCWILRGALRSCSASLRARTAQAISNRQLPAALAVVLLVLLAGCSGSKGPSVHLVQLAAGDAACPAGGVRIQVDGSPDEVVCNGSSGSNDTISTTTLAPGDAHCPFGGIRVDVASAGKPQTQYLCNAATSHKLLVRTTPLPVNDSHCVAGGIKIEFGSDVQDNGVFDPANIISTQYLCSIDSAGQSGSLLPPAGAPGVFRIRTSGGAGSAGFGGSGGSFTAAMAAGTLGGHVKLFKTGTAVGPFQLPPAPATDLGPVSMSVASGNQIVFAQSSQSCAGLTAGSYFTAGTGTSPIFHCQTATAIEIVTGLSIAANATVTFQGHSCSGGTSCLKVRVQDGCRSAGTIAVDTSATGLPASLSLDCGDFYSEAGSRVNLHGSSGGPGGALKIQVLNGALWNQSAIDVGGDDSNLAGATAGAGGSVTFISNYSLYNTGAIAARGGAATGAAINGGAGGNVLLESSFGGLTSLGTIDSSGGNGVTSGGAGGEITLSGVGDSGVGVGTVRSLSSLTTSGGSADPSCLSGCAGGAGGPISLRASSGDLASSGSLTASGGDGAAGQGGAGGSIALQVITGNANYGGAVVPAGNLAVSGNLDSHGGNGGNGGAGGAISISLNPGNAPNVQEIALLGYAGADTSGGNGSSSGGSAGGVTLQNANSFADGNLGAGGGVVNYVTITAAGGSGAAQQGGDGGGITLQTQTSSRPTGLHPEPALNFGDLTMTGGAGFTVGGRGGFLHLYGRTAVENGGAISSVGGDAATGRAGAGGSCIIDSDSGAVLNHGAVRVDGGKATASSTGNIGGSGGYVELRGAEAHDAIGVSARGGASAGTGAAGTGGTIVIAGTAAPAAVDSGIVLDARGGGGSTAGGAGNIIIDGRLVTGQWTH